MQVKKRLPPVRRRLDGNEEVNRNEDAKIDENDRKDMEEFNKKRSNQLPKSNAYSNANNKENNQNFELPEFLKKAENEQYLLMFMRMRQRHQADGAVSLNLESEDISDQNVDLYDNKGINLDMPILNENLASNVEHFIESIARDQFIKIPKKVSDELENQILLNKEKTQETKILSHRKQEVLLKTKTIKTAGLVKATEDELFAEFDLKLTEIINNTSNKVSLLFLFTQGLLAGVSLINILLLFQYTDFASFLKIYSNNVREIFNFTHALTFASLVGNGVKFVSCYNQYKIAALEYKQNENKSKLKKSMIFSGVILTLFIIIFGILMYLASYIPAIFYSRFTISVLIDEDTFKLFGILYVICNFISIFNFILNIFDVKVDDGTNLINKNSLEIYDPEETRENSVDK